MRFINNEAILYLNKQLKLPARGCEQDWEIELADASRLEEFITFYEDAEISNNKRFALMALIIASLEDFSYVEPIDNKIWGRVSKLLCADRQLHQPTIDYWSVVDDGDNPEDSFKISRLIRSLKCN